MKHASCNRHYCSKACKVNCANPHGMVAWKGCRVLPTSCWTPRQGMTRMKKNPCPAVAQP